VSGIQNGDAVAGGLGARGFDLLSIGGRFVAGPFHAGRPDSLEVIDAPSEIPGGFLATYKDPGGVAPYVMDQSTDQSAS
jgi:hypothetical protein